MSVSKLAIPALLAVTLLSGCAGVDAVSAGKPADLGDGVSVVPTTVWARVHGGALDPLLTIDGIGLGEVRYFTGVKPGDPLFKVAGVPNAEIGGYKPDMLPNDVMELLVANLSKAGAQDVQTAALKPAKFGSRDGFAFNLSFVSKDGLNMRGEALATQRNGKLDMLLYTAPDEYYFAHRQADVEQLFATILVAG